MIITDAAGLKKSVFTNSKGYYRIVDIPNGSYTLRPVKRGWKFIPRSSKITVDGMNCRRKNFAAVVNQP